MIGVGEYKMPEILAQAEAPDVYTYRDPHTGTPTSCRHAVTDRYIAYIAAIGSKDCAKRV